MGIEPALISTINSDFHISVKFEEQDGFELTKKFPYVKKTYKFQAFWFEFDKQKLLSKSLNEI
ncbi:MAG: hypothetical protein NE328_24540 [Lentisphaeraceae bacterium]|nr:hypothetical protein [Lentisphaeraceae bacterium]